MSFAERSPALIVAAAAMLLFSGCRWVRALGLLPGSSPGRNGGANGGADAVAQVPAITFAHVAPILRRNCAEKCHDGRAMAADDFVFVDTGDLRARLLGPAPATVPTPCRDRPLVVPGEPDRSLLVAVIEEPDGPRAGCAERMPHSCPERRPCITGTNLETIRGWINAGALP
ncbi:MAG: hypothetical protein ABJA82_03725 [Myxococcales bacterium]